MKIPEYRPSLTTGVVHFGPGAFHRAHQADYFHTLLHEDPRWGIAAVSMRSSGTVDALRSQGGLYTLAILDTERSFRTIGAHTAFFGPGDAAAVRRQLADPDVRVVTSTVTEKGYCLTDGVLDFEHPDIAHDGQHPDQPKSLVGWLVLGLRDRRSAGASPFVPICCDNMNANGRKLGRAVLDFAGRLDPELARWIDGEVAFPSTMVDSITPATDGRLRELVRRQTGSDDAIPVSREAYAEWVIEDVLPAGLPDLGSAGATIAADVTHWERAKLRILNGAHSTLAYVGLLLGHETVAEAMSDPTLSRFVERLAREDILPSLEPSPLDLDSYVAKTLQRFRNPAIEHRLSQIAWDGSQKLPYRLLDTIAEARRSGRSISRLVIPISAWILFLERQSRARAEIVDPLTDLLQPAALSADPANAILDVEQVFSPRLSKDGAFRDAVIAAAEAMRGRGVLDVISSESADA